MSQNPDKPDNEKNEPVNWKSELISWIQIIIAAALIALFLNSCIIANSQVPYSLYGKYHHGPRSGYRFQTVL